MTALHITPEALAAIESHATRDYPEECCGTLLGLDREDGSRAVKHALAVSNTKDANRKRRYLIDPAALLEAERTAAAQGLDVVGIYHSHPDHPSRPSEFDREHAMPFWSYIIVSCLQGRAAQTQSWRLRDDRSVFEEESWDKASWKDA